MDTQEQAQNEPSWFDQPFEAKRQSLPRTLAGLTLQVELPSRLIDRDDIYMAAAEVTPQTATRVLAAALMLCWPSAQRKTGAPRYKGDILDYGGQVYDFLLGHGATKAEILRAGHVAAGLCSQAAMAQHFAQEEARGNSQTPGVGPGSSSSSPSSGGPGSPSVVASVALNPRGQGS